MLIFFLSTYLIHRELPSTGSLPRCGYNSLGTSRQPQLQLVFLYDWHGPKYLKHLPHSWQVHQQAAGSKCHRRGLTCCTTVLANIFQNFRNKAQCFGTVGLGCSISDLASCNSLGHAAADGMAPIQGMQLQLPASSWRSTACCSHLGSESGDRSSLSLPLPQNSVKNKQF